ncbi:MAG: pyridoxamine 5'-phosphate oxidase family protein [Ardenticatenaceae bacterium]|nr:pyridoxamine 5'-phosphate oxidase family protein [Ardenticatenaceae bacterium]HBY98072.1 pyridoxamine 5'-phosphate oxidase [Chloroflexota bacterium]
MRETSEGLEQLQQVLDRSIERAGDFLRNSFQMPHHSLSAAQLVRYFQGLQVIALSTVTAKGEPRVAPIGALFFRGHFYIPTLATAARTRHVLKRPAVSLTHFDGTDLAIIVHGRAAVLTPEHPKFATLEALHRERSGQSVRDWGEGVYLRVDPEVIYTFARHPAQYPE